MAKKEQTADHPLSLRLQIDLVDRADALIDFLAKETGGVGLTRSDVFREAIVRGLRVMERAAK